MNDLTLVENRSELVKAALSEELYNRWLAYIDVRPKTVETYRKAIKQFFNYMYENEISQPTREDIIAFRDSLKDTHKPTTVQTYLTATKLFFQWLEQEGIYHNVAQHIKGVKIEKGHKKDYLTSKQSHKVLETVDTTTLKGLRDYAIVALMLTTGMRTIEVERADVTDLRTLGDSTVLYLQGKGRDEKTEYVKVAPQVEDALRAYLNARGEVKSQALFTSTSRNNNGERMTTRAIRAIAKEALVNAGYDSERLTAHSMRHTAGTLALLNGAELTQVQQLLRHSSINTTMIYLHGIDRAKNNSELKVANAIF